MRLPALAWCFLPLAIACGESSGSDAQVETDAAVVDAFVRDAASVAMDVPPLPDVVVARLPDWKLPDINPRSPTFQREVGTWEQNDVLSVWYFATANCHTCALQSEHLQRMQVELDAMPLARRVKILLVADLVSDGAALLIVQDRPTPTLQDSRAVQAQMQWGASLRDVVVRDPNGLRVFVMNLTDRPLEIPENYQLLRSRLIAFAQP